MRLLSQSSSSVRLDVLDYLLCLTIFSYIVWPYYIKLNIGLSFTPTKLLILLWFGFAFVVYMVTPQRFQFGRYIARTNGGPYRFLLAFVAWRGISCIFSSDPNASFAEFARSDLTSYFPLLIMTLYTVRSASGVRTCFLTVFLAAIVVSVFGIMEWRAESNPFTIGLTESSEGMAQLALDKSRDGLYRAQSTFFHPLAFGQFIVIAAAMSLGLMSRSSRLLEKIMWSAAYCIFTVAVVATNTRSSIIGMFAVTLCLLFRIAYGLAGRMATRPQRMLAYAVTISIVLIGLLLSSGFIAELVEGRSSVERSSSSVRVDMLISGIPVMLNDPLFGLGIQMGARAVGFTGVNGTATLDNMPLYLAVESGIPSAIFLYAAVFIIVVRIIKQIGKGEDTGRILFGLAVAGVLFSMTSTVSALMQNFGILYLAIALALICVSMSSVRFSH